MVKQDQISGLGCLGTILAISAVGLYATNRFWGGLFGLLACCLFVFFVLKVRQLKRERDQALDGLVDRTTREHVRTLRIQVNQRKVTDAYGNTDATKAVEHIVYFINNVIFRELKSAGFDPSIYVNDQKKLSQITQQIFDILIEDVKNSPEQSLDDVRTGIEYEHFCRLILEDNGWVVITTPVTGDQGADLIAANEGLIVVIQCKFYSKPVGNKAVQEAYAAKAFQQAHYAAVVSNAAFTPSARQLAGTNGVFLLHHDDLSKLNEVLWSH